jgi:hypothetical protein
MNLNRQRNANTRPLRKNCPETFCKGCHETEQKKPPGAGHPEGLPTKDLRTPSVAHPNVVHFDVRGGTLDFQFPLPDSLHVVLIEHCVGAQNRDI